MHDAYMIGIPTLVIILGILLNRSDAKDLRVEIGSLRTDLDAKISAETSSLRTEIAGVRTDIASLRSEFHQEFREFYRTLGQHDIRIESLEKRQAS